MGNQEQPGRKWQPPRKRWLCVTLLAMVSGGMLLSGPSWRSLRLNELDKQYGVWDADDFWSAIVRENKQWRQYRERYESGNVGLCQMRLGLSPDCLPHRAPDVKAFASREDLDKYLASLPQGQLVQVFALVATDVHLHLRAVTGGLPGQVYPPRLGECGNYWFFTLLSSKSEKDRPIWETLIGGVRLKDYSGAWAVWHLPQLPQVVALTRGPDYTEELGPPTIIWFAYARPLNGGSQQRHGALRLDEQARSPAALTCNASWLSTLGDAPRPRAYQTSISSLFPARLAFTNLFSRQKRIFTPSTAEFSEAVSVKAEVYTHERLETVKKIPEFEIPHGWHGDLMTFIVDQDESELEPTSRAKPKDRLGKIQVELKDGRKYVIYFYSRGHNPALLEVNEKHWVWARMNWFLLARDGGYDLAKLIEYIYTRVKQKDK